MANTSQDDYILSGSSATLGIVQKPEFGEFTRQSLVGGIQIVDGTNTITAAAADNLFENLAPGQSIWFAGGTKDGFRARISSVDTEDAATHTMALKDEYFKDFTFQATDAADAIQVFPDVDEIICTSGKITSEPQTDEDVAKTLNKEMLPSQSVRTGEEVSLELAGNLSLDKTFRQLIKGPLTNDEGWLPPVVIEDLDVSLSLEPGDIDRNVITSATDGWTHDIQVGRFVKLGGLKENSDLNGVHLRVVNKNTTTGGQHRLYVRGPRIFKAEDATVRFTCLEGIFDGTTMPAFQVTRTSAFINQVIQWVLFAGIEVSGEVEGTASVTWNPICGPMHENVADKDDENALVYPYHRTLIPSKPGNPMVGALMTQVISGHNGTQDATIAVKSAKFTIGERAEGTRETKSGEGAHNVGDRSAYSASNAFMKYKNATGELEAYFTSNNSKFTKLAKTQCLATIEIAFATTPGCDGNAERLIFSVASTNIKKAESSGTEIDGAEMLSIEWSGVGTRFTDEDGNEVAYLVHIAHDPDVNAEMYTL